MSADQRRGAARRGRARDAQRQEVSPLVRSFVESLQDGLTRSLAEMLAPWVSPNRAEQMDIDEVHDDANVIDAEFTVRRDG